MIDFLFFTFNEKDWKEWAMLIGILFLALKFFGII